MGVVPQLLEYEDPFSAAARTAAGTMTPLGAVYEELRVIADRRLSELPVAGHPDVRSQTGIA